MIDFITLNYMFILLGLFICFLTAEAVLPQIKLSSQINFRWAVNFSFMAVNFTVIKSLEPLLGVLLAFFLTQNHIGLLNQFDFSVIAAIIFTVIVLDIKQYCFHRVNHAVNIVWRAHQVHHSEKELDLTSSYRFHPLETVLNELAHFLVIIVFGIPVEGVILMAVLVNFSNFFTHANIQVNTTLDRCLRWLIVTPSMHRIHHSLYRKYHDTNFGSVFSVWDRLFGTYTDSRVLNEEDLAKFGLPSHQDLKGPGVIQLLALPFRR